MDQTMDYVRKEAIAQLEEALDTAASVAVAIDPVRVQVDMTVRLDGVIDRATLHRVVERDIEEGEDDD